MLELKWSDYSTMQQETDACFRLFKNIKVFFDTQAKLYGDYGMLCFGDCQIDAIAYDSERAKLTVRIVDNLKNTKYCSKQISRIFYVFDFYGVDNFGCDIAPEHWISDIFMQKLESNIILFDCDAGLKFSFSSAEANRCWCE